MINSTILEERNSRTSSENIETPPRFRTRGGILARPRRRFSPICSSSRRESANPLAWKIRDDRGLCARSFSGAVSRRYALPRAIRLASGRERAKCESVGRKRRTKEKNVVSRVFRVRRGVVSTDDFCSGWGNTGAYVAPGLTDARGLSSV